MGCCESTAAADSGPHPGSPAGRDPATAADGRPPFSPKAPATSVASSKDDSTLPQPLSTSASAPSAQSSASAQDGGIPRFAPQSLVPDGSMEVDTVQIPTVSNTTATVVCSSATMSSMRYSQNESARGRSGGNRSPTTSEVVGERPALPSQDDGAAGDEIEEERSMHDDNALARNSAPSGTNSAPSATNSAPSATNSAPSATNTSDGTVPDPAASRVQTNRHIDPSANAIETGAIGPDEEKQPARENDSAPVRTDALADIMGQRVALDEPEHDSDEEDDEDDDDDEPRFASVLMSMTGESRTLAAAFGPQAARAVSESHASSDALGSRLDNTDDKGGMHLTLAGELDPLALESPLVDDLAYEKFTYAFAAVRLCMYLRAQVRGTVHKSPVSPNVGSGATPTAVDAASSAANELVRRGVLMQGSMSAATWTRLVETLESALSTIPLYRKDDESTGSSRNAVGAYIPLHSIRIIVPAPGSSDGASATPLRSPQNREVLPPLSPNQGGRPTVAADRSSPRAAVASAGQGACHDGTAGGVERDRTGETSPPSWSDADDEADMAHHELRAAPQEAHVGAAHIDHRDVDGESTDNVPGWSDDDDDDDGGNATAPPDAESHQAPPSTQPPVSTVAAVDAVDDESTDNVPGWSDSDDDDNDGSVADARTSPPADLGGAPAATVPPPQAADVAHDEEANSTDNVPGWSDSDDDDGSVADAPSPGPADLGGAPAATAPPQAADMVAHEEDNSTDNVPGWSDDDDDKDDGAAMQPAPAAVPNVVDAVHAVAEDVPAADEADESTDDVPGWSGSECSDHGDAANDAASRDPAVHMPSASADVIAAKGNATASSSAAGWSSGASAGGAGAGGHDADHAAAAGDRVSATTTSNVPGWSDSDEDVPPPDLMMDAAAVPACAKETEPPAARETAVCTAKEWLYAELRRFSERRRQEMGSFAEIRRLPLAAGRSAARPTESRMADDPVALREEEAEYWEKMDKVHIGMDEVAPGVFCGSRHPADDVAELRRANVSHVISCIGTRAPEPVKTTVLYMNDRADQELQADCMTSLDVFRSVAMEQGENILVHCGSGVSRAPAVVIYSLARLFDMTADVATSLVRAGRPCICLNSGFRLQLLEMFPTPSTRPTVESRTASRFSEPLRSSARAMSSGRDSQL